MMGRTHEVVAVSTALALGQTANVSIVEQGAMIGIAFFTARLPDIDIQFGIPHRTVTHYAITAVAIGLFFMGLAMMTFGPAVGTIALAGFLAGYGSHILADACTLSGVPLFGPFTRRDFHLLPKMLRLRTGGFMEFVVAFCLVAADAVIIVNTGGI
jgi:membrane-bound metal-dependent hydrolase YbcI (DUF457 family)